LIAIEGTVGRDVRQAASELWRRLRTTEAIGGVSKWDASGIFSELHVGRRKQHSLSPRALVLLYAADLAFRLRWEIRPALEHGQVVIAAPYVETAAAVGTAAGLPRSWLRKLFGFAPSPDACYRVKARGKGSRPKGKRLDGYAEFCAVILADRVASASPPELRSQMAAYLDEMESKNRCARVTGRLIADQHI
jgi:hypothetical protein